MSQRDQPIDECGEAIQQLYTYLDGELTDDRRTLIHDHLESCGSCLEAFDFEAELRTVVSRRCHDEVPESLRTRIAESLRELG
jgi:mycothiol system anti-sigma-R factor